MPEIKVGVAHPGTQHSWQTALAFQEHGNLRWYATSSYYKASAWPDRAIGFLPSTLRERIEATMRRRRHDDIDDGLVRRHLESELFERATRKLGLRPLSDAIMRGRHLRFPKRLMKVWSREPVDAVWGPMDCLEAFRELKKRGVKCVLDQPIGHYAALDEVMRSERERHPEFFLPQANFVRPEQLARQREAAEIADLIIVGSEFAASTMRAQGVSPERVVVIPYGFDERRVTPVRRELARNRPVEFLFIGSVGPRKGCAYLFKAFEQIDPRVARLTVVGPLDMPVETFAKYAPFINYVGQVSRPEVAQYLARSDCFLFPSLFEGSALVLYEAVGAGLGIVQSNSAGIGAEQDRNGIILEHVSVDALLSAIDAILEEPSRLLDWSRHSEDIRTSRTWAAYRRGAAAALY